MVLQADLRILFPAGVPIAVPEARLRLVSDLAKAVVVEVVLQHTRSIGQVTHRAEVVVQVRGHATIGYPREQRVHRCVGKNCRIVKEPLADRSARAVMSACRGRGAAALNDILCDARTRGILSVTCYHVHATAADTVLHLRRLVEMATAEPSHRAGAEPGLLRWLTSSDEES